MMGILHKLSISTWTLQTFDLSLKHVNHFFQFNFWFIINKVTALIFETPQVK